MSSSCNAAAGSSSVFRTDEGDRVTKHDPIYRRSSPGIGSPLERSQDYLDEIAEGPSPTPRARLVEGRIRQVILDADKKATVYACAYQVLLCSLVASCSVPVGVEINHARQVLRHSA